MSGCNNIYCTISDYSTSNGAMPLLYAIRDGIPFAFEGLLIFIFMILFAGNYFLVKSKTGRSKILTALISSSFLMVLLSLFLALGQLVSFMTVILYAFILIVVFIMFEFTDSS